MLPEPPRDWSFVPPGAAGPRILIRRQWALRPIVTANGAPVRAKWNLRTSGIFVYLILLVVLTGTLGSSSAAALGLLVPIGVSFFLVELPWLGSYAIPLADGTTVEMRIKGARRGMRAVIGGQEIHAEEQLSTVAMLLAVLPWIALIATIWFRVAPFGGPNLLGSLEPIATGVLGFIAFAGGQVIVRSVGRVGAQAVAAILLTIVVGGANLGLHYGRPAVALPPVGTCLDVGRGGTLRNDSLVDCEAPHLSEVIGVPSFEGAYPGLSALGLMVDERCGALFADYVGRDPDTSSLQFGYFPPTKEAWDLGLRTVVCIAYPRNGTKLSHSIRAAGI